MATITKVLTDDRFGYFIIILLLVASSYVPLTISGEVHPAARGFYDTIESLKPGDTVMLGSNVRTMLAWEFYATGTSSIKRCLEKGANIIWWSGNDEALINDIRLMNEILGSPFQKSSMYGTRFVYLGYFPTSVPTVAQIAKSIRSVTTTDLFGTSLDEMEATKNIDSGSDVQLCYVLGEPQSFTPPYWNERGVPCVVVGDSGYSEFIKDFNAGIMKGVLAGVKFGYAYEQLIGKPGKSFGFNTGMIFLSLLQIFGIIVINVIWLLQKQSKVKT